MERQAKIKGVTFNVQIANDLQVSFDESALVLIVRNMVSNALKFSPSGTTARVAAAIDDGGPFVEVVDQGSGFSAATLSALQVGGVVNSAKGTAGERGHGLGLTLSAELARRLGGRLEADNAPGEGGRVRLRFSPNNL